MPITKTLRLSLSLGLICATLFVLRPDRPVLAVTVFDNLNIASTDVGTLLDNNSITQKAVVFQVPEGQNYQLNSVTARMRVVIGNHAAMIFDLYTSNTGSTRGTFLGRLTTPDVINPTFVDVVFTPASPLLLTGGSYYWLQTRCLGGAEVRWDSSTPVFIPPTGLFSFISYQLSTDSGNSWVTSNTSNPIRLDADVTSITPPPPPPSLNEWNATADEDRAYAYGVEDAAYGKVIMFNGQWEATVGSLPIELVNAGVLLAVDVYLIDASGRTQSDFANGYEKICLLGDGRLIFLDAKTSPRQLTEILPTTLEEDYTCGWIPNAGTVVLIQR